MSKNNKIGRIAPSQEHFVPSLVFYTGYGWLRNKNLFAKMKGL